jgi:FAD/FMN-containing dehydrogenase
MGPSCIFTPSLPEQVSLGIQLLAARDVPFAIRGGGQMPLSNAGNIGPEGILFSSSNLSTLVISEDKSTVTVGSGIRFKQLYDFLAPHGVIVNGVRLGDVGVVGFHLGGGIGFFSYEYGMAPGTVKSFDVGLKFIQVDLWFDLTCKIVRPCQRYSSNSERHLKSQTLLGSSWGRQQLLLRN